MSQAANRGPWAHVCQVGLVAALACVCVTSVWADDDKKTIRSQMERIQRMQQTQQSLEEEKGLLTAEKMAMETKLKTAESELSKAMAGSKREGALRRESNALRAEKAQLLEKMTAAQSEHDKIVTDLRAELAAAKEESAQLKQKLATTESGLSQHVKALTTCEANNQGLYKLNTSLLEQYEKRTCTSEWLMGGTFTQLGRVKAENNRETFQDKLDELRVTPVTRSP